MNWLRRLLGPDRVDIYDAAFRAAWLMSEGLEENERNARANEVALKVTREREGK